MTCIRVVLSAHGTAFRYSISLADKRARMATSTQGSKEYLIHEIPSDIKFPIEPVYCELGIPVEYCEYFPDHDKCKQWLKDNLPDEFERLSLRNSTQEVEGKEEEGEKKKRQTRGGRGVVKPTKKKQAQPQKICLSRAPRGKKKFITVVTGLGSNDIDLKQAAKLFGQKCATGSSVTGEDEIVIQGDVKDDLYDIILEKWPNIDEDNIDDLGDKSR